MRQRKQAKHPTQTEISLLCSLRRQHTALTTVIRALEDYLREAQHNHTRASVVAQQQDQDVPAALRALASRDTLSV